MGSPLEMTQANAFKMFEKSEGIDFFNEYCDYLIDDETGESV
jgi:hypothetical protein